MRSPSKIRQADVQRVLRGVAGSGMPVGRISVDPETGIINVFLGNADIETTSAYDEWAKTQNAR